MKINENIIPLRNIEIDSRDFAQFRKYLNNFYGKKGVYPNKYGKDLDARDILKAIDTVAGKKPKHEWEWDSLDRELVRDELIKMRKFDYPTQEAAIKEISEVGKIYDEIEIDKDEMEKLHKDGEVEVDGEKISFEEGKKVFKVNPQIGKSKYSISSHDGVKKHKDGSDFFDIEIFKNKVDLEKAIKNYKSKGFVQESTNEATSSMSQEIASMTGTRQPAVQQFIDKHKINALKLAMYLNKQGLRGRMDFAAALAGKPGNPIQKKMIKMFSESVNEAIKPSQVSSTISKVKKELMRKWKQKGGYENFGQKELSQMKDKFDYNPYGSPDERQIAKMLDGFNNWAMNYDGNMREDLNEADVVGKTIFSDGKGKLFFGYYKTDDAVEFVDYKTWKKLGFKDVSKGDTNKERVIKAILKNQKQFNKKVDFNMWAKQKKRTFEETMDWFIQNGWINNINKGGIKESLD